MFQLTDAEADYLVSQNVIPSKQSLGGTLPYVFTQEGVAMLSGVLRSQRAVKVNIAVMRAFVRMRDTGCLGECLFGGFLSASYFVERRMLILQTARRVVPDLPDLERSVNHL